MPERIVDGLELVEVEMMDGHQFPRLNPAQRLFESVVQQHPVRQIGQRIVVRHVLDLDLGLALLGDVLMGRDPAAAGHRPVADLDRAPVLQSDDTVFRLVGDRDVVAPADVFFARHGREAAGFDAQVDDLGQLHAGVNAVGRNIIDLDKTIVADDQAVIGIEEAQPLRHVVDGGVELEVPDPQRLFLLPAEFVLRLQSGIEPFALGDVLVGRHPAAARHRVDGVGDDPAVNEFLHRGVECDVAADALTDVIIRRDLHFEAEIEPMPDQFAGRRPRLHLFRRQPVHFPIALVAESDFALFVEYDDSKRQIVDRLFESRARLC